MSRGPRLVWLAWMTALLLAACSATAQPSTLDAPSAEASTTSTATPTPAPPVTLVPGVLTVAVPHFPYPGYIQGDDATAPKDGYYISMMDKVAAELGLKINYITADFTAMMGLQFNDYDIMMTTLSITPERQQAFNMTTPVVELYEAIMTKIGVPTSTAEEIRNLKLGTCGTCSTFKYITDIIKPNVEPFAFEQEAVKYDSLAVGQIDGALGDLLVMMAKSQEAKYTGLGVACKFEPPTQAAWALPKDSTIIDTVNKTIETMKSDGTLDTLYKQFLTPLAGGGDPASIPACPTFD